MAVFPTSKISHKYVAFAFGYVKARLSTLCRHPSINMWAKYKPVQHTFTYKRPSDWWKGMGRDCSLEIPRYTDLETLIQNVRNGITVTYKRPQGGSTPFRLEDFLGYDSSAKPPIQSGDIDEVYYQSTGLRIFPMTTVPKEGWLSVNDIYSGIALDGVYYGAAIVRPGASSGEYITTSTTAQDNGSVAELILPLTGYSPGKYEIYQFICTNKKTSLTTPSIVNTFIPIGDVWMKEITIKTNAVRCTIQLVWNNNSVAGDIIFVNETNTARIVLSGSLQIRYGDKKPGDPTETGETIITIEQFNMSANQTVRIPVSVSGVLPDIRTRGGIALYNERNGVSAKALIGFNI